ncbi:hypothetical protein F2Q69_00000444 [Brassica cretica]|uniref:Uncharacterized protein n=1 Tax=Brassica cretica TaxID=69181 RepID=A0A8S9NNZ4_BRACR|nr:hypothetical protein F2Q69_00000444 [Brassica cretica]
MITIWVIQTEIVYADKARNGDRFSSTMGFKSIHDEVPWYLADATGRVAWISGGWLHLSLLQYYLQLSLKKFSLNETSSQIADGFNFLFQVVNFVFTSQREFFSVNYNVSFHNNFSDLMMLVIVS